MHALPIRFSGTVVSGEGRGATILSTPTLNIDLQDIPAGTEYGIYAGRALIDEEWFAAAIHFGERPVFKSPVSFEVHVIDRTLAVRPATVSVELLEKLRDVRSFNDPQALKIAIDDDITRTKEIVARIS